MKAKEADILKAVLEEIEAQGYTVTSAGSMIQHGTKFGISFSKKPRDRSKPTRVYERDLDSLRNITGQIEKHGGEVIRIACDVFSITTKLSIEFVVRGESKRTKNDQTSPL